MRTVHSQGRAMSGSMVANLKGRMVAAAVVVLGGLLLLSAPANAATTCGEEGAGPLILEAKVTPGSLPSQGGTGAVYTRVEDDCGVQVIAEISSSDGFFVSFELLPGEEDINTNHRVYRGEFQVPQNFQEAPVGYQVTIRAIEQEGPTAEILAGEIEVAGVPPFDEPPYIYDPTITRSIWGYRGGTSVIGISAEDIRGVAYAYAVVTNPDGSETEVPVEPVSASRFEGPLQIPRNLGGEPAVYSVSVFAADDIGQTTGGYAGTVTVEPKGTPNPGFLSLEATNRYFGSVPLAHKGALRSVRLSNPGKPGSPPVSGFLRTSDPQFFFPGAGPEGVPFTLEAGEEGVFQVDFRPDLTGRQSALVALVRADGRQPQAALRLFGWGGPR
jgi:hypothetical protein